MHNKLLSFLAAAALPALLCGDPTGLPFGPSTTELDYGPEGSLTVVGCTPPSCAISGLVPNPLSLPLTYMIDLDIPAGLTLQGIPSGNTTGGDIELDSGTVSVTVSDTLGDSLSANVSSGAWTAGGDAAVLDLSLVITSAAFVTPGLSALVASELGFTPVDGSSTSLILNTSCPTTCITSTDPIATILGGTIGGSAAAATPEPGSLVLLGCGLAAIGLYVRARRSAP